jgi:hypothetical protein
VFGEVDYMTDKQYDGMLKEQIAGLDRIARITKDEETLNAIYEERKLAVSKLGCDVEENGLYDKIKK